MNARFTSLLAALLFCGISVRPASHAAEPARPPIRTIAPSPVVNLISPNPVSRPPVWIDAEQRLESNRQLRAKWGESYDSLESYYQWLSSPASSGSQTLAEHLPHLKQWCQDHPKSPDARVVTARALTQYAWEARGSGWAATVTEDGWKLFHERTAEAHRLLDEAIDLGVKDGEAYTRLLNLAYAESQPREVADGWLAEGIKLDPTYYSMYNEMAVFLMPRWGGEPGDIERFADHVAEKLPGDNGLEAFARIALTIQHYECGWGETLFRGEYDYSTLVKGAEVLVRRHPRWNAAGQFAAVCALVAQDHAAAKRIRPFVGKFDEKDKIWVWENSHRQFMHWSAAAESPRTEENWVFAGMTGVPGIAFGNERRHVWVGQQFGNSAANLMDMRTGHIELALPSPGGVVNGFLFDPARRWAMLSAWRGPFTGWMLWDLSGAHEPVAHATDEKCTTLALHPTRPIVFWLEGKKLRSFNFETDAAGLEVESDQHLHHLIVSRDGSLVAANQTIYDATTGEQKLKLGHTNADLPREFRLRSIVAIDDEQRILATATPKDKPGNRVSLIRIAADGQTSESILDDLPSDRAWLSPDGKLLATTPGIANGARVSPITIWSLEKRQRVKQFDGHWNSIRELVFSPDGTKLASIGFTADAVKTWSLEDLAD